MDCRDGIKLLKNEGIFIDHVITSPPYNLQSVVKAGSNALGRRRKIDYKDNMTEDEYFDFISGVITGLLDITKKYIFFNIQPVSGNKRAVWRLFGLFGKYIKEVIIWKKTRYPPAVNTSVLSHNYEFIIVFDKQHPEKRSFDGIDFGRTGKMATCWEGEQNDLFYKDSFNVDGLGAIFQRWLPTKIIENFTKKDEIILDPFSGAGTTALVAKELGRRYIGFEISETNVKISKKRVETLTLIDNWI